MKNEKIAEVLKEVRKQNALTVKDVVLKLDEKSIPVAEKTLYGWESGQAQPDADTLLVLCEIYDIPDILGAFGYRKPMNFNLSRFEERLIMSYRNSPDMQAAIKKLLDVY